MTPHKADLNSALHSTSQAPQLHSRSSAVNSKLTQALTLVRDKATAHIGAPEPGKFKPLTAEQAAGNILGFIQRQIERDIANGASDEELESRLQAGLSGFKKGFNEAREQLEALSLLDANISASIGKTYDLVTGGIDQLAQQHLGKPLGELSNTPTTGQSNATANTTWGQYQYASAQSFRFDLQTREGDTVSIQANASHAESRSWRAADGSSSSASNFNYQLNISGDLNEAEKAAIDELLQQIHSLADSFFSGDIASAYDAALELGYNHTQIEGFALNLTRVDIQRASSAYGSDTAAADGLQNRLQPVGQFLKDSQEVAGLASQFAEPYQLLMEIVEGLYGDTELPGNRDGKNFVDFVSELLDKQIAAHSEKTDN